jgi:signal transduction histidine kinase
MGWIRIHLRQLRWQLTLSYAAVTVVSLLAVAALAAAILFSKVLLPENAMTPQDWVDIARKQSQAPYGEILAKIPDTKVFSNILDEFNPTIASNKLVLFGDLELYVRTTGVIDALVTDREGKLLAVSKLHEPYVVLGVAIGFAFDPGLVPGLGKPLAAALQGKTDAGSVFNKNETGDGFVMAVPIFNPDRMSEVVGVIAFVVRDLSTEADRGAYFGIVLLRSLVIILIAAIMAGTAFGAITAEGLAGRFRRIASASEAWSTGDFSTRIREDSRDEIGALADRLDGMAEDLQELVQKRQELVISQERDRLARELHDSAKQLALAASFQIGTARQLFTRDPQAAAESLAEAEKLVDKVRRELTDLIYELHSTQMDGRDFHEILRTYATEWAHASGIGVQLDLQLIDDLPLEYEKALYRIMQEALANVARHSRAGQVVIELHPYDGEIQLIVRDDGIGFGETASRGMGMSSMLERAEAIGGFTRITSQPGLGTEVQTVLPIPKKVGAGFQAMQNEPTKSV